MALLKTKFLPPIVSAKTVQRSRLQERLAPRPGKRATLVIAPAGFGKTTLISSWAHTHEEGSCWLSLDQTDNNIQNFWRYVIGALQQVWPDVGREALNNLTGDEHADVLPAITSLMNDIASAQTSSGMPVCLVLDDYHVIDDARIHQSMAYFVDYLPPLLNLILASRIEPELPLARWRVKSFIDELYTTDLAFNESETQAFFKNYAQLELAESDLAQIQTATSGWIAAMQLLILSQKQGAGTAPTLDIGSLLGSGKRLIDDYVLAEILGQQPQETQDFLLDSSCLIRMNFELCDAIRDSQDSRDILATLERLNLFIVPLDNRQYWYRFHDLFREALLSKLQSNDPARAARIQHKAIHWFLEHENYHEALSQLIGLQDWDWTIKVLEEYGNVLIRNGYHLYLMEWLNIVPSTMVEESPRLLMLRIWCLFYDNKIEALRTLMQQLQQLLKHSSIQNRLSQQELQRLQNEAALVESCLARDSNKQEQSSHLSQQVLEQIQELDIPLKSVSYYGVGLDYFRAGDLTNAIEALESAIHFGKMEKRYNTVLSSLGLLMWIHFSRGELTKALSNNQVTQNWLENFHKNQPQPELISCWRNTSLSEIYREQNNLLAAQAYLNPLLRYFSMSEPGQRLMIHYAQAGLAFSQTHYKDALEQLDNALAIYDQKGEQILFEPPSLRAMKLRCFLKLGELDSAQLCARQIQQSASLTPINRLRESLALARMAISEEEFAEAEHLLATALDTARDKLYQKHEIQSLILLSRVYQLTGRNPQARQLMASALELAEKSSSLRLFADEGADVRNLIEQSSEAGISEQFRKNLLSSFIAESATPPRVQEATSISVPDLAEPVSKRELEVLQLINEGLANKQIASKLHLAPATVKAHIRNLYGKIGATSRTEALAKARKLGLME